MYICDDFTETSAPHIIIPSILQFHCGMQSVRYAGGSEILLGQSESKQGGEAITGSTKQKVNTVFTRINAAPRLVAALE